MWEDTGADLAVADLLAAGQCGRVSAVAGQVQRDLHACAGAYRDLFPDPPFDPAFYSTIALANTFCAPWLPASRLRLANRVTLWNFGLDRLIDEVATARPEIDDLLRRCRSVMRGAPPAPGDSLAGLLAEIGAELAELPAYPWLGPVWLDELDRVLVCMAREWDWKAAHAGDPDAALPSLADYLDNAVFGFALVYVTQWMATAGPRPQPEPEMARLRAAGQAVEQVIRLLNDLGSYPRDMRTGDLNALKLGVSRTEVTGQIDTLVAHSARLLQPLRGRHEPLVRYLERHIAFNTGFYRVTDYQAPVRDGASEPAGHDRSTGRSSIGTFPPG